MRTFFSLLAFVTGFIISMTTMFTLMGLGLHRHGASWAIASTGTFLVFGPPLVITGLNKKNHLLTFGISSGIWATLIFASLPVYFPGERNEGLVTGLSTLGITIPATTLPRELDVSKPVLPKTVSLADVILHTPPQLADDQIALAYEGEGRRLTVELAVKHEGQLIEMNMMLDTGATYTTLPRLVLATLGILPGSNDPSITLQTANGERTAKLVLVDQLWLGDLVIENVAIAVCDACASDSTAGLLGLNVTGGYNLNIDADRREVVFSTRKTFNRHLDIKPFVDIEASVSRFQGGRVEVDASIINHSDTPIETASVSISCRGDEWLIPFEGLEPNILHETQRRLPNHESCERYQIGLKTAAWTLK